MPDGYLLTPGAQRDLRTIVEQGKRNWSPKRVDSYIAAIQAKVETLADFPEMGTQQSFLIGEVRTSFVGSHVIIYRGARPIEILAIAHHSSDWNEVAGSEATRPEPG